MFLCVVFFSVCFRVVFVFLVRLGVFRDQLRSVLAKCVADVLRDYLGLGERQAVGGDEKRHLALRVHGEVLLGLDAANLGGVCDGELIFYGQPVYDQSVPGTVVADGDVVEDILAG